MLKVAVIAAAELPIPAVLGGATETMMTNLLLRNESEKRLLVTVFSHYNQLAEQQSVQYKHSNFIWYKSNKVIDNIFLLFCRFLRKITRGKTYIRSRFALYCAKRINSQAFDLVLLEGNHHSLLQFSELVQVPLVLHMHIDGLYKGVYHDEKIAKASKGIIAISEYCKKRIASINQEASSKVYLVRNSIDLRLFDRKKHTKAREIIRKDLGIGHDDVVFMYSGRIVEDKGILDMVLAFLELKQKAVLLVVGGVWYSSNRDTKFTETLKKTIGSRLNQDVFLTGYIPQSKMPEYYAAADVNIIPSKCEEAAGLSAIEAQAMGNPVIVSDRGGLPEYAGENSSIVAVCDTEFVANIQKAMKFFLENPQMRLKFSKEAQKFALRFDTSVQYNSFCNTLEEILYDNENDA